MRQMISRTQINKAIDEVR